MDIILDKRDVKYLFEYCDFVHNKDDYFCSICPLSKFTNCTDLSLRIIKYYFNNTKFNSLSKITLDDILVVVINNAI